MKLLNLLLGLPALALAAPTSSVTPLLASRQSTPIQVTSVSATGSGCPAGSWTIELSPDGQTLLVAFNNYQVAVGPGIPSSMRERTCDVTVGLSYPLGCTTATIDNTYHGFAELHSGVSATMSTQYSHSPGTVGPNPPPVTISGAVWEDGNPFNKQDIVTTRLQATSSNQRVASYTIRTRAFVQTNNSQNFGTFTIDDLNVDIASQASC